MFVRSWPRGRVVARGRVVVSRAADRPRGGEVSLPRSACLLIATLTGVALLRTV